MSTVGNLQSIEQLVREAEAKLAVNIKGYEKISSQKTQLVVDAAKKISPNIRAELGNSYGRSGIGTITGELRAAVLNSQITVTPTGIKCQIQAGKDQRFYAKASSQQHGWVTGKGGRRLKKLIKKAGKVAGGLKPHAGHHYYTLKQDQVVNLSGQMVRQMQPEVTKLGSGG